MKTFRNLIIAFCTYTLFSCNNATIEGSWVQTISGMPGMQQGFTLETDGSAFSIHMATLKYEKWRKEGNLLFLSGVSIGNHQNISFTDTLTIEKLTQDSLILKKGKLFLRYSKTSGIPGKEIIPATLITPAKKLLSVKGELVIGHEVRSFTSEGDSCNYWIVDETGELIQRYDNITKGVKNGKTVHAELEVIDLGKSGEGFAADYAGVYQVIKIKKMTLSSLLP